MEYVVFTDESKITASRYRCLGAFSMQRTAWKEAAMDGVSFDTKQSLFTYNPKNPVNFWYYEPGHENDKAPVRGD